MIEFVLGAVLVVSTVFVLHGCGVKGDPLPPLAPGELASPAATASPTPSATPSATPVFKPNSRSKNRPDIHREDDDNE